MDLHGIASLGRRRRLVDLRFRPGLQIKLPALLLAITGGFSVLFLAHTNKAYGALLEIGLEDPWLRSLVQEIQYDYFVVSLSIGIAYAIAVVGVCLAGTHRVLGPIVALQRHLEFLKKGNYSPRIRLRSGHPLSGIAKDLNELSEILQRSMSTYSAEPRTPKNVQIADQAAKAVDRLLRVYTNAENLDEETLEPNLASLPG